MSQLILKEGLRALIEGDRVFRCVDDDIEIDADVTVIDLSDDYALEKVRQGPEVGPKLLVLTDGLGPNEIEELVRSGARAVVAKTADHHTLLNALRIVANGGMWLDPQVAAQGRAQAPSISAQQVCWSSLTDREMQVATLMIQGRRTDGISADLSISCHTVGNYRRNIFRKLNINSRLELVRYWSANRAAVS